MTSINRRSFVGRTLAGAGLFAMGPLTQGLSQTFATQRGTSGDDILILLQLSGGNDGLSTLVPYGDDAYYNHRKRTQIAAKSVLRLDDYVGLHPAMKEMKALYDEGQMAVIQGAGYANPNRSHFKSTDIWNAASARGKSEGTGWVGRLAQQAFAESTDPNLLIHVGSRPLYALHNLSHPAVSFSSPLAYKWVGVDREVAALEAAAPICEHGDVEISKPTSFSGPNAGRDRALEVLRKRLHEAQASSELVRQATRDFKPKVKYPSTPLAASLATISALINGGLSTRIFSLQTGGFDTHTNQKGRHDTLMLRLSQGVSAFLKDMKAQKPDQKVTVLVYSEFGRRVKENGSGGTDHGTAGPVMVLGNRTRGGLHGKAPSLTDLNKGDLKFTTDFRRIYASIIRDVMGQSPSKVLGGSYNPLPLFKS